MSGSDKYPEPSGRRRFVKGVVGGACLATVGTATGASTNATTAAVGAGGGSTEFFGIENTEGPAPRGLPMIPVRVDDDGFLRGLFPEWEETEVDGRTVVRARTELGGVEYGAPWFQYCGVQTYPGLQPGADQDSYFRYGETPYYDWQREAVTVGERLHVDHFEDYGTWGNDVGDAGRGKPAMATWRSEGVPDEGVIPVQVLRLPPEEFERTRDSLGDAARRWFNAATDRNFVAWLNKCTHFCCTPSFKGTDHSLKYDAGNDVYCPCHQSVYDPNSVVRESFVALPRPRE